jgi:hypothetical protein
MNRYEAWTSMPSTLADPTFCSVWVIVSMSLVPGVSVPGLNADHSAKRDTYSADGDAMMSRCGSWVVDPDRDSSGSCSTKPIVSAMTSGFRFDCRR